MSGKERAGEFTLNLSEMSRLLDRILTGCQPCRLSLMLRYDEFELATRSKLKEEHGSELDDEAISAESKRWAALKANDPIAKDRFDFSQLTDVPVIAADDVAAYATSFPKGTNMADVVSSMAPPFDRFFVEFQKQPNNDKLTRVGCSH